MKQFIDKDALVAELESKKEYAQTLGDNAINGSMQQFYDGMKQGCVDTLSFIHSLKVKEVDLDFQRFAKEMEAVFSLPYSETENTEENPMKWEFAIAKHFYNLGLRKQKEVFKKESETNCPNFDEAQGTPTITK